MTLKHRRHRRLGLALGATALVAVLLATPITAQAATTGGQRLLGTVEQGTRSCSDLSNADFEAIGETLMGRVAGSPQAHQAMNRMMVAMLGSGGEEQVHEYMGRRLTSCGGGTLPAGFGRIMGMMGTIGAPGMMGGGGGPPGFYGAPGTMGGRPGLGVTGSRPGGGAYPGSMMLGYGPSASGASDDDGGPSAGAMIGMMAVFIAAVGLGVLFLRPRARHSDPLAILGQRFASGELGAEEYQERADLLKGGGTG